MQVYRDLRVITARPTPEEEAPRAASALRPCRRGGKLFGRALAARRRRGARRDRGARPRRHPGRRHRALFQGADRAGSPPCRRSRPRSARRCARACKAKASRRSTPNCSSATPRPRSGDAERPLAHLPRARSGAGDRALALRLAPRGPAGAGRSGSARRKSSSPASARNWWRASRRALPPCSTAGALEEVRALAARGLDPLLPAMKAHGVPWLIRHLAGEISLDEAAAGAVMDTRRYAKRQLTWFRNQMQDWPGAPAAEAKKRARKPACGGLTCKLSSPNALDRGPGRPYKPAQ